MAGLLVAGTNSDAGKSVITAGICRWLLRRGVRVAPFKAQNMSNNSAVAIDASGRGGEIGRAQAMQAAACGLEPDVRFNPVLLKPGSDLSSQVVLLGRAVGDVTGQSFRQLRPRLSGAAFATLDELRREYDVVVCEGAGSPAEINLREHDFVNLGLARHFQLPVIVAADIDRGGAFASLFGTVALLAPADQALVAGFVINKFRGYRELLQPGLDMLYELTGRPTYGVLPWHLDVWLDAEDSLAYGRTLGRPGPPLGAQWLRVAVVRLPHLSNATDAEALATEPGVSVRLTIEPADLAEADLVVLPGTKSTVDDLAWLRRTGLADALARHVAAGRPVLGICGGFQMLGTAIHDDVESGRGTVPGLGLLPIEVTFASAKTLARPTGTAFGAVPVSGYEIHHGVVSRRAADLAPLIVGPAGTAEGAIAGGVSGTHWHGAFESDGFRRAFLAEAATRAGRDGFVVAPDTRFHAIRERHLELLGDLVEEHLDTEALWRLIEHGPPADLPFIPPGPPPSASPSERQTYSVESYADLAARILAAPARVGRTRLVAIDGPSGAGKTAFAERLAGAVAAATGAMPPVVHTDDLLDGWSDQLSFWPRLARWVLDPLRAGRAGRYRAYDWERGEFNERWHEVPPAEVVLLEGMSAARAELRPELALAVFVSAPADVRLARAIGRDGEALRPYLDKWRTIEERHFAADATAHQADLVVDGAPQVPHNPQMEYVRATDGWTAVAPV